ncbi:Glutathione peroxidase [Ectocarpus siliculosus]|uniref:Glutathione peroxidase n=1 Tax=Ectocarpus siliculosus TaxID=2880 RepID=D7G3E9_ECTSI|nr:Glutathione peroxidase [Ectocarpus siliculosus]|eukprot:CBJ33543.1 Glutathione peroxidase [Ectocarpus siliculosus]
MATAMKTAAGTTAAVLLRGAGRRPLLRIVSTAAVFTSSRLLPPPPPRPPLQGTETASARGRFNPSAVARGGVTKVVASVTLSRCSTTRRRLSSGGSSEGGDGGEQAGRGAAAETGTAIPLGSKLAFKAIVDGKPMPPDDFEGKAVLVVNTASLCGLTPQLKELELVHKRFRGEGLVVLGVPSNDFGAQEPWDEEKIKDFYAKDFGVTFPLTSKTVVVGPEAHPLYSAVIAEFGQDVGPQ